MMRAYNSWIADLTSQASDRLKWVTLVDPVDPHASVGEIKRTKEMGSVAVMLLGVTGDIRIDDPAVEPIWAAANEVGLPVAVHTGHSFRALGQVNDTHHDKTALSFWLTVQFAFQRVISKGIADRYPNLRIAFLEAGCSWVPGLVERITDYSGFPGARAGEDFRRGYKARHLPKEYIERGQIYFGFEVDEKLLRLPLRSLAMTAGFTAQIFHTATGSMARWMSFCREKISARRASASSLSITARAFTVLRPRTACPSWCSETSRRVSLSGARKKFQNVTVGIAKIDAPPAFARIELTIFSAPWITAPGDARFLHALENRIKLMVAHVKRIVMRFERLGSVEVQGQFAVDLNRRKVAHGPVVLQTEYLREKPR
jgi:hypothetical protein